MLLVPKGLFRFQATSPVTHAHFERARIGGRRLNSRKTTVRSPIRPDTGLPTSSLSPRRSSPGSWRRSGKDSGAATPCSSLWSSPGCLVFPRQEAGRRPSGVAHHHRNLGADPQAGYPVRRGLRSSELASPLWPRLDVFPLEGGRRSGRVSFVRVKAADHAVQDLGRERSPTMTRMIRCRSGGMILAGALAWALATGLGFLALCAYEVTPGSSGQPVESWPGGSRIALAGDRYTLVMAAHPRCPCTRASTAELARILARCDGRVAAYVLIFTPEHADPTWGQTDWSHTPRRDPRRSAHPRSRRSRGGSLRRRTSGHVALYAPDGRLLFRGGITGYRGQEGVNRGQEAVLALIGGGSLGPAEHLVFGCPIFDPSQPPITRDAACSNEFDAGSRGGRVAPRRRPCSTDTAATSSGPRTACSPGLLAFQWLAAIATALVISPSTWAGDIESGPSAYLGRDRAGRRARQPADRPGSRIPGQGRRPGTPSPWRRCSSVRC